MLGNYEYSDVIDIPADRLISQGLSLASPLGLKSNAITPLLIDGGSLVSGEAIASVGVFYPGERVDILLDIAVNDQLQTRGFSISLDRSRVSRVFQDSQLD